VAELERELDERVAALYAGAAALAPPGRDEDAVGNEDGAGLGPNVRRW
jgi:hypothetical protein